MARASFVGPSQAAMMRGIPGGQFALDGVVGDHGIIDQQAERDDQSGDRDLLQIDGDAGGPCRKSWPA